MTWVNSLGHVSFPFARWQHDHARVHSSKVELAVAGVHPVGKISSHASVWLY